MALTNCEILVTFKQIIKGWFQNGQKAYNDFIKALLSDDVNAMNRYINQVALASFSYFDTGKRPFEEAERFYHGFVLGLIVELEDTYFITSNREMWSSEHSSLRRYDVMLEEKNHKDAIIMEFKVQDSKEENTLQDTINNALNQIELRNYAVSLTAKGIKPESIRKYGFAFEGKQVLIGKSQNIG